MKKLLPFLILSSMIGCSADKDKNYGDKLKQRAQAQHVSQAAQNQAAQDEVIAVEEEVRKCTNNFKESLNRIQTSSEGPFFRYKVRDYSNLNVNKIKYTTEQAHDFLEHNLTLDNCLEHTNIYSKNSFSCIDEDLIAVDFTVQQEYCETLINRNEKDSYFKNQRTLYKEGDKDFIDYLALNKALKAKYTKEGRHIREVKKIKVNVLHDDFEHFVNSNFHKSGVLDFFFNYNADQKKMLSDISSDRRVIDGVAYNFFINTDKTKKLWEHRDQDLETINKFIYYNPNTSPKIIEDTALIVCHFPWQETPSYQLYKNFVSFESSNIEVKEQYEKLESTLGKSSSKVVFNAPVRSLSKTPIRAFRVECHSQVAELLTIENLNKTLRNFIDLEVIEVKQ